MLEPTDPKLSVGSSTSVLRGSKRVHPDSAVAGDVIRMVAGVDEAGRGALAGPVVAAAVVMEKLPEGVTDSKRCTAKRREVLAEAIRESEGCWAIGEASVAEIDALNILNASLLAMKRAIQGLAIVPSRAMIDGPFAPSVSIPCQTIIGGDALEPLIGAASILAKTHRDALMRALAQAHPEYGFDRHKGYPTKAHSDALSRYGASTHHRRSFAPVRAVLKREGTAKGTGTA